LGEFLELIVDLETQLPLLFLGTWLLVGYVHDQLEIIETKNAF
jgi:hypothetical protein